MNEIDYQKQLNYDNYVAQSSLAEQQNQAQSTVYAPQMQEQVAQAQAILVNETNPNRVLKEIELSFRNVEADEYGNMIQIGPPIMNERGINRMKFIMRPVINQIIILSNVEEDEIGKFMNHLADTIADDLALNWKSYGIVDKNLLDHIIDSVIIPAFFNMRRSLRQNEKNWLGKISVENISSSPRINAPKKGGFWDKLKL